MTPLPKLTGLECVEALQRAGFVQDKTEGIHQVLKHPQGGVAVIPVCNGETLGAGLLRNILASAGLKAEALTASGVDKQEELIVAPDAAANRIMPKLLQRLPLSEAMANVFAPPDPAPAVTSLAAEAAVRQPALLQAAIWLYVDDLDRSHNLAQNIESPEGFYWHGIMHRREGDFWNAKYWFRRAGQLPAKLGQDPIGLTDKLAAQTKGECPPELVNALRREWLALFEHCAGATG